jgi:hypothetical protein
MVGPAALPAGEDEDVVGRHPRSDLLHTRHHLARKFDKGLAATRRRIEAGDPQFKAMSEAWSTALRDGFTRIPI